MFKTKKYLDIEDTDRSESNYCISGRYYKVDPDKISFEEWVEKSLKFNPEVDFTYWEFDVDIGGSLKNLFMRKNKEFTQKKYIITNRRIVHVFDNGKQFHRSIHTRPESIMDFLLGIYKPTYMMYFPKSENTPDAYMIRNNENKTKSYLNVHDKKLMKIQTSFLNEGYLFIEDLGEVYSSDIELFLEEVILNEEEDKELQEKYSLLNKLLYTYDPKIDDIDESNSGELILESYQIGIILNNIDFIKEELSCDYFLEDNILKLLLKK